MGLQRLLGFFFGLFTTKPGNSFCDHYNCKRSCYFSEGFKGFKQFQGLKELNDFEDSEGFKDFKNFRDFAELKAF